MMMMGLMMIIIMRTKIMSTTTKLLNIGIRKEIYRSLSLLMSTQPKFGIKKGLRKL